MCLFFLKQILSYECPVFLFAFLTLRKSLCWKMLHSLFWKKYFNIVSHLYKGYVGTVRFWNPLFTVKFICHDLDIVSFFPSVIRGNGFDCHWDIQGSLIISYNNVNNNNNKDKSDKLLNSHYVTGTVSGTFLHIASFNLYYNPGIHFSLQLTY